MLTPSPFDNLRAPHIAELTDLALSLRDAAAVAGDWQRPALISHLDDLFELLVEHDRYMQQLDDDDLDGDGVACDDDCDDGDDWEWGRYEADGSPISGEGRFLMGGE